MHMHAKVSLSPATKVEVDTEIIDRDSIKKNVKVLVPTVNMLGLRVGVNTCTVHVSALYDLMQIPISRSFDFI